jgi:hypothetical protein
LIELDEGEMMDGRLSMTRTRTREKASLTSSHGNLYIRYSYEGRRNQFPLKLRDSEENRALGEQYCRRLTLAYKAGNFDTELAAIRSERILAEAQGALIEVQGGEPIWEPNPFAKQPSEEREPEADDFEAMFAELKAQTMANALAIDSLVETQRQAIADLTDLVSEFCGGTLRMKRTVQAIAATLNQDVAKAKRIENAILKSLKARPKTAGNIRNRSRILKEEADYETLCIILDRMVEQGRLNRDGNFYALPRMEDDDRTPSPTD